MICYTFDLSRFQESDDCYSNMMSAMIPKSFNYEGKPPILNERKLKIDINAEYEITKKEI